MKRKMLLPFFVIVSVLFLLTLPIVAEERDGYSYMVANGEVTIYNASPSLCDELVIPERIDGYPVTKIGRYAFSNCKKLTSVILPSTLVSIESYAFQGCASLVSVTIPDSVKHIGDGVFKECTSLKSPVFPNGMTEIPPETFWGCSSLKTVIIPENIRSVGRAAFFGCSSVTKIYIPESVTEIGYVAFDGCVSVEKITVPFVGSSFSESSDSVFGEIFAGSNKYSVPKSLKEVVILGGYEIPAYAFEDCDSIEKISIPDSVSKIGEKAFYKCFSLKEIVVDENNSTYQSNGNCLIERETGRLILGCQTSVIPDDGTVKTICAYAFSNCVNVEKIIVPNSIQKIELYAFFGCSSLKEISVPFIGEKANNTTNTHFGYIFGAPNKESHNNIFIPESLKTVIVTGDCSIAQYAFLHCRDISFFTATSSIKNVAEFAFVECSGLQVVRFEGELESLGQSVFLECSSLTEILLPSSVKKIGRGVFENCPEVKILCEEDSVAEEYAIKNNIEYEIIEITDAPEITPNPTPKPEPEPELESDPDPKPENEDYTLIIIGIAIVVFAIVAVGIVVFIKKRSRT